VVGLSVFRSANVAHPAGHPDLGRRAPWRRPALAVQTAAVTEAGTVRKATGEDVAGMARALARAFEDDPVMEWFFPNVERRRKRLPPFMTALLRLSALPHDHVYTTDGWQGAALWNPPGTWQANVRGQLRLIPSMVRLIGTRLATVGRALPLIEKHHPREPHWYLLMLGTEPQWQGKGIGSALVEPVLARCDEEGMPAYLESSKERNIPFYSRHGFEVTGELRLPGGPPMWPMWRNPRPAA
jgi:GNAT superfamily N-acetyltransferase